MARLATVLVTAVALAACSTPAMKVETNHDSAAVTRLRSYRTYQVAPSSSHGAVQDVAMGPAVVRSVDQTLGSKGYRQDASRPDFVVKWHVSIATRERSTTLDAPTFRDVRPMPSAGTTSTPAMVSSSQEREGTLVLDVVDGGSNTIVWRGSGRAALTESGEAQTREDRIQEAVRRILERFPPQ